MCFKTGGYQISVRFKSLCSGMEPSALEPLVLEPDPINAKNVINLVEGALSEKYKRMRDVAFWCFHAGDEGVYPGMLMRCTTGNVRYWLKHQAETLFQEVVK